MWYFRFLPFCLLFVSLESAIRCHCFDLFILTMEIMLPPVRDNDQIRVLRTDDNNSFQFMLKTCTF